MRQNVGFLDRTIRVVLALTIIGILVLEQRTGAQLLFWLPATALLLGTGVLGYCPLYGLLGVSTRRALPD